MTHKGSVLSLYIKNLIIQNRRILTPGGVDRVFYGDQRIISAGTVICVEPSRKVRNYAGTGFHMETTFETSIIFYAAGDEGVEDVQLKADQMLEATEDVLNKDAKPPNDSGTNLGGLIVKGWVASAEHGYRIPASQMTRANRMVFNSTSRQPLV